MRFFAKYLLNLTPWQPQSEIGCIIVHVGTNDAATSRVNQLVDIVADNIAKLFDTLKILYPHAQMMFSSILPRFDDDDARGKEINKVSSIPITYRL